MTLIVNKLISEGKGSKIRQEFAGASVRYSTVQYSTVQYGRVETEREVRNVGTISRHCVPGAEDRGRAVWGTEQLYQ